MNHTDEKLNGTAWALVMAASGQATLAAQILRDEARRRWGQDAPPGNGYSDEAQRIKMEKAEAKRLRRNPKNKDS